MGIDSIDRSISKGLVFCAFIGGNAELPICKQSRSLTVLENDGQRTFYERSVVSEQGGGFSSHKCCNLDEKNCICSL